MANHETFPLGGTSAHDAYQLYLEPGQTAETVAASLGVGHNTLREAFRVRGYKLKVNKRVNPREVIEFQKQARAPVDYLAARYGVRQDTVRKWLRNPGTRARLLIGRFQSRVFWETLAERCESPAEFFTTLASKPHELTPQHIPAVYHRRIRPSHGVFWQLEASTPAKELDDKGLHEMAQITEPDDSPYPLMFLGYNGVANPVRWVDEESASEADSSVSDTNEEQSDLDLESIMEDL